MAQLTFARRIATALSITFALPLLYLGSPVRADITGCDSDPAGCPLQTEADAKAAPVAEKNTTVQFNSNPQTGATSCQKEPSPNTFTCEGYPAFNPNKVQSMIGSKDGINTDCGDGPAAEAAAGTKYFLSERGTSGYRAYEFAKRYFWFRWGINMTHVGVTGPIPSSATQPIDGPKGKPVNSFAGIGDLADLPVDLCNGLPGDAKKIPGALIFLPGAQPPVAGDLVVLAADHIGIVLGSDGAQSIAYANQNLTPTEVKDGVGGYTMAAITDPGICAYVHAYANTTPAKGGCASKLVNPKDDGADNVNGTFTGTIILGGTIANPAVAQITQGIISDGKVTGNLTGADANGGIISGALTGSITDVIINANVVVGGTVTATITNGTDTPPTTSTPPSDPTSTVTPPTGNATKNEICQCIVTNTTPNPVCGPASTCTCTQAGGAAICIGDCTCPPIICTCTPTDTPVPAPTSGGTGGGGTGGTGDTVTGKLIATINNGKLNGTATIDIPATVPTTGVFTGTVNGTVGIGNASTTPPPATGGPTSGPTP